MAQAAAEQPSVEHIGAEQTTEADSMDNTQKFTDKVSDYRQFRPTYPDAFIRYLFDEVGLSQDACVGDIGAGTGILTRALVDRVKTVYAIEPNRNMRHACMDECGSSCGFVALDGSAESTGLPDQCLDFIVVAQAFHWFEPHRTQQEFARILKPDGIVVLVWNSRLPEAPLTEAWAAVCREFCPDFTGFSGGDAAVNDRIQNFFRDGICEIREFENNRVLDEKSFIGTGLSTSYAPSPETPAYWPYQEALSQLFGIYAQQGQLEIPMRTHSYTGRI